MKICFAWPFDKAKMIMPLWRDGHRAAIEELAKYHKVDWFINEDMLPDGYDFYLIWDDGRKYYNVKGRKGLMLTTENTIDHPNLKNYDVIYCESKWIRDQVRAKGMRAILAMGTDTSFFCPDINIKKDIEYFYPATFSPWKRQSEIADLGNKLLCIGTIQPDGYNEYYACVAKGVRVIEGYIKAEKIRDYYQKTKNMIIPAVHGSERTVLEAMATNILPEVTSIQNVKARSYVDEFKISSFNTPREYVLEYYSHFVYAKQLLKGIEQ